jgi:hypothetical protein
MIITLMVKFFRLALIIVLAYIVTYISTFRAILYIYPIEAYLVDEWAIAKPAPWWLEHPFNKKFSNSQSIIKLLFYPAIALDEKINYDYYHWRSGEERPDWLEKSHLRRY